MKETPPEDLPQRAKKRGRGRPKKYASPEYYQKFARQWQISLYDSEFELLTKIHERLGLTRSNFIRLVIDYDWLWYNPDVKFINKIRDMWSALDMTAERFGEILFEHAWFFRLSDAKRSELRNAWDLITEDGLLPTLNLVLSRHAWFFKLDEETRANLKNVIEATRK